MPTGGNILTLGDPELYKYPFAYMSEPGFWTMTEPEMLTAPRSYVEKGGFRHLRRLPRRALVQLRNPDRTCCCPKARLVELDVSHPIFHSFFEVETLDFVQFYGRGEPTRPFTAIFEDNDPSKRLLLIANYNNDIGEYWEYSDSGLHADRALERGVQAGRELRHLFDDALACASLCMNHRERVATLRLRDT